MMPNDPGRFHTLTLAGNEVVLDTAIGHLRRLALASGGGTITPLHTAPWVNDDPIDPGSPTPPTEQGLSGDFFCAPFCLSDVEDAPLHGWTANSPWRVEKGDATATSAQASFVLEHRVMGAEVRKTLAFEAGHPFLYAAHDFSGGSGRIPVSHHAMIRAATTVRLSFSPKALFFTPDRPAESDPSRGRSLLKYPASGTDIAAVPLASGGTADIRTYPFAERHEDILAMSDAPGQTLGWSAAVRDDDIVLLIKDSRVLPQTMLWMSNGGRDFPPWSGRHTRVLGIEDGCSFGPNGHRASTAPNMLTERGVVTAIDLGANPHIGYAIGAVPRPSGWSEVSRVDVTDDRLRVTDIGGKTLTVPFDAAWVMRT